MFIIVNIVYKNMANIKISDDTWRRLKNLKEIPGEDFNDIVIKLLDSCEKFLDEKNNITNVEDVEDEEVDEPNNSVEEDEVVEEIDEVESVEKVDEPVEEVQEVNEVVEPNNPVEEVQEVNEYIQQPEKVSQFEQQFTPPEDNVKPRSPYETNI